MVRMGGSVTNLVVRSVGGAATGSIPTNTSSAGNPGEGYGAGGGGASANASTSTARTAAGGAGTQGIVIVEW